MTSLKAIGISITRSKLVNNCLEVLSLSYFYCEYQMADTLAKVSSNIGPFGQELCLAYGGSKLKLD